MQIRSTLSCFTLFCSLSAAGIHAETVLRFSWWGAADRNEATEKVIHLFENHYPGIRIIGEPSEFATYQKRLASQIANGTEPDIMQLDWAWLSIFSSRGDGFFDLNTFSQTLIPLDEFTNQSYRSGMVYGKLNGLPTSYTSRIFIWNKTVFDRARLPLPETWEQLLACGPIFQQRLGKDYYPLDGNTLNAVHLTHAYIMQKTGKPYIQPNSPEIGLSPSEIEEWSRYFRALYTQHVIAPLQLSRLEELRSLNQHPEWPQGKWAGSYNWASTLHSHASTLGNKGTLTIGKFLTQPDAKSNGKFGRPAQLLAVKRSSRSPDVAARFVSFMLTDPEAIRILGTTRGIPLTRIGLNTLSQQNLIELYAKTAQEQINSSRIDFPSALFESDAIRDLLLDTFEQVALGKLSDRQAAEILAREGARILSGFSLEYAQAKRSGHPH